MKTGTPVMCVALGILACLVLVALHDGRRYTVKNHEVEVKISKETLETALRQKKLTKTMMRWFANEKG